MSRISDYSLIGNCHSAALVSKQGSIDWCCLPEFHSPALFSALLDKDRGGHFSIAPAEDYKSHQQYIEDTNVIETIFKTASGEVRLRDAFVATTEEEKLRSLFPDHEIIRILKCVSGNVLLRMEFEPSVFYGRSAAALRDTKKMGIKFSWKENEYILQTTLTAEQLVVEKNKAEASFQLQSGDEVIFSFSCSSQGPAIIPEIKTTGIKRMEQTIQFWKAWIGHCAYDGMYKEQVRRSALALKLLAHAPSGAIIAAPTTSLPEQIGGDKNWDYRYCWLRDASFTVRALLKLGFEEEAHAYMNWILHATQLTQPKLQIVYSVYGQAKLKEQELNWLNGFQNSRPVRIGNGAYDQYQLDVYGEVLDAFFSYSNIIKEFDRKSRRFMIGLGNVICKLWEQPDNGIWEVRSSPAHHTHSKVMAWVGLDRLVKLSKKYSWKNVDTDKYEKTKTAIEQEIERSGYNRELQSYTSTFNGNSLDASSLVFSLVGFCPASSPEMVSTVQRICEQLSKNNLIFRYRNSEDGLQGDEGCFGICSFWLAENLAKSGKLKEAVQIFETVLEHASPAGLLSEEIDPSSHELLGNYPQGFTHIGLINAAISINEAYKKEKKTA
jgi:GH15 family glucan-1,4-alpha-glucosidase